jgi:hypothetical protein
MACSDLPYTCDPVQAEASAMNTDDPVEQFSLMTRTKPPLAVPPMIADVGPAKDRGRRRGADIITSLITGCSGLGAVPAHLSARPATSSIGPP